MSHKLCHFLIIFQEKCYGQQSSKSQTNNNVVYKVIYLKIVLQFDKYVIDQPKSYNQSNTLRPTIEKQVPYK